MIGRAYLWGLAANGQAGVENVLDVLSGGRFTFGVGVFGAFQYLGLFLQTALGEGADEYIMKPFDRDIIEAKFHEVGLI